MTTLLRVITRPAATPPSYAYSPSLLSLAMSPVTTTSGDPPEPPYDVEFRTLDDDAWYTARIVLDGNNLVVKFLHFDDGEDIVIKPQQFSSIEEVEEMEKRLRPVSKQLQDKECRSVSKGTVVCASHSFSPSDICFYDAVVDDVIVKEHRFDKAEEECTCNFLIVWQHGLCSGNLATKRVEDICVVQPEPHLDPKAAAFFINVKKRLQNASRMPSWISNGGGSVCDSVTTLKSNSSSSIKDNLTFLQRLEQRKKPARRSLIKMQSSEVKISDHSRRIREDTDIGGDNRRYLILIGNLDKDLSSSTIVEFVRKETSITVEACIFPSLPWVVYHEGVISVDCQRNLEKVCRLLDSSDCIVVSKRGRPCVVTGKLSQYNLTAAPILASMLKHQDKSLPRNLKIDNGLKVVYSGSEEYKTAAQLKDIFIEFVEHQQRLHERLAMNESQVLKPSPVT